MNIKWYGHSCFRIRFDNNTTLLTDPYNADYYGDEFTYSMDFEHVDIITISHQHNDHNFKPFENAKYFETEGEFEFNDIKINGIKTYHDKFEGNKRGQNILFIFEHNNKKIAHLGDLGHIPSKSTFEELQNIDIIFIPIGGTFTIDGELAKELINRVNPKIIFPMHYKNEKNNFPIQNVDDFLKHFDNEKIIQINDNSIDINEKLYNKIIVLKPV